MNNTSLINTIKALPFNEENFEFIKQELIKSTFPKSISEQVEDKMSGDDDSDWNYPNFYSDPKSVEVDLFHKISALETKTVELGEAIWKRVRTNEEVYLANKSKIEELDQKFDSINSRLKGTNYELVKIKKILIEDEEE